jgi:hypothetical protein
MKKLIFFILLITVSTLTFSQSHKDYNGYFGLRFKMSPQQAIKALKGLAEPLNEPLNTDSNYRYFTMDYLGMKFKLTLLFNRNNNTLNTFAIKIDNKEDSEINKAYDTLLNMMTKEFGKHNFESDYNRVKSWHVTDKKNIILNGGYSWLMLNFYDASNF